MDEYSSPTAAQRASNVQLAASLAAEAADLLRNASVDGLAHKARELAYECETAGAFLGRAAGDLGDAKPEPRQTAQCADCGQSIRVEHGHFVPHGDGRPDERSCEGSGKPPRSGRMGWTVENGRPVNTGVTPLRTLSDDDYGA